MAWQTLTSRTAYENPWIRVREDTVLRPDGAEGLYGVIELRDAVFVVALDEQDRVVLITIDRYTTGPSIEVPGGGSDGQDPLVAAQRELLEETGLEADDWTRLGGMDALNGAAAAPEHIFLARGLRRAAGPADGMSAVSESQLEEGISTVSRVPFGEVVEMIRDGRMRDGESIAVIAIAGIHLGRFA